MDKTPAGLTPEAKTKLDDAVARLRSNQALWASFPLRKKIGLVKETIQAIVAVKSEYMRAVVVNKKSSTPEREYISFAYACGAVLNALAYALEPLAQAEESGQPVTQSLFRPPSAPVKIGDQFRVRIMPDTYMNQIALAGVTGDIYLQKGKDFSQGAEFMEHYKDKKGGLSLVLVAGNQTSIGLLDCIDKLFVANHVVVLKHNPVNGWVLPIYEKVLAPFVKHGFAVDVAGGIPEGAYLIDQCDDIHITGSDKTYDAIVWGRQDKTDPMTKPLCTKPISSELGSVTPNVIVPGPYSAADLKNLACYIIGSQADNCGFNCNSPKLIVTCKHWPQREQFLQALRAAYKLIPTVYAYYPGSVDRWQKFKETYSQAELYGESKIEEKFLPWLFIPGVPAKKGELAIEMEPWAPVLSETALDVPIDDFIPRSVEFLNEVVWGNLSCSYYIHPTTEAANKDAFEKALVDLRYGGVAVNQWSATIYSAPLPWGAAPGNTSRDIRSGFGFVHNSYMIDHIDKAVMRFPFYMALGSRLHYHAESKNSEALSAAMADLALTPSLWNLGRVFYHIAFN